MTWLAFEEDPFPASLPGAAVRGPAEEADEAQRFAPQALKWVREALTPYLNLPLSMRPADDTTLPATVMILGERVDVDVELGPGLLEQMTEAYAVAGWPAIDAILAAAQKHPASVRNFVARTRKVIGDLVLDGLTHLEQYAIEFARDRWRAAGQTLKSYLKHFRPVGVNAPKMEFANPQVEKQVIALCHEYALAKKEADDLEEDVAERRQGNYKIPGSGQNLWFEKYAAPQRAAMARMDKLLVTIVEVFPAAAFVLDDLPAEVLTGGHYARKSLPEKIYWRVTTLLAETNRLLDSLKGAPTHLPLSRWWQSGGYTYRDSLERRLVQAVLARGPDELKVMGNPHLLAELDDPELDGNPVTADSWEHVVLRHYRHELDARIEADRAANELWDKVWAVVMWFAALIAAAAAIVLTGGWATPAVAAALATAAKAASLVSLVVFFVRDVYGGLRKAAALDQQAREQLYTLAQQDPEGMRALGALLAESAAIRRQLSEGLLSLLIQQGVARFTVIARALDLQGFLDDVQTLFSPLEQSK